jgi:hypothetical protein
MAAALTLGATHAATAAGALASHAAEALLAPGFHIGDAYSIAAGHKEHSWQHVKVSWLPPPCCAAAAAGVACAWASNILGSAPLARSRSMVPP